MRPSNVAGAAMYDGSKLIPLSKAYSGSPQKSVLAARCFSASAIPASDYSRRITLRVYTSSKTVTNPCYPGGASGMFVANTMSNDPRCRFVTSSAFVGAMYALRSTASLVGDSPAAASPAGSNAAPNDASNATTKTRANKTRSNANTNSNTNANNSKTSTSNANNSNSNNASANDSNSSNGARHWPLQFAAWLSGTGPPEVVSSKIFISMCVLEKLSGGLRCSASYGTSVPSSPMQALAAYTASWAGVLPSPVYPI